jgi:hypothetical protein
MVAVCLKQSGLTAFTGAGAAVAGVPQIACIDFPRCRIAAR